MRPFQGEQQGRRSVRTALQVKVPRTKCLLVIRYRNPEAEITGRIHGSSAVQCGIPEVVDVPGVPVARIAAGLQSRPGANPWAASVRLKGTQKSFHWCGAVILSEFHVLTVAHCMEDYPKDVYRIRVGDWDMQVSDLQEQEFKVDAVHYHEEYNVGLYLNNDIAVVRIRADPRTGRGFSFGSRVVPACLPHSTIVYGEHLNCTVSGWGSTGVQQPGFTRYLQVPILEATFLHQLYFLPSIPGGPNPLARYRAVHGPSGVRAEKAR